MSDLFEHSQSSSLQPLAERVRPREFEGFVGQTAAEKKLTQIIQGLEKNGFLPNIILWGPPGCGKTTWARIIGEKSKFEFIQASAIDTGAKDIRDIGQRAYRNRLEQGRKTILFIDEIHRLNRSQQDVLLPFTEKGDLCLIGATTENPSYELNAALLSRCQVIVFERLEIDDLNRLAERASRLLDFDFKSKLSAHAFAIVLNSADGDGRKLLNTLERVFTYASTRVRHEPIEVEELGSLLAEKTLRYDKSSEEHYDTLSAFIKSLRGSDSQAALYYLARMIKGGENPTTIARRMVILASEDVGNADPKALPLAVAGMQAVEMIGLPEAGINLAQVATYLASAPKSNRSYAGYKKALRTVEETGTLEIPLHIRNAQTALMKGLGYGKGYKYAHDHEKGFVEQSYLPTELKDEVFYEPSEHGFEKTIRQYVQWLKGSKHEN